MMLHRLPHLPCVMIKQRRSEALVRGAVAWRNGLHWYIDYARSALT